ncbi:MAG: hypothetical protein PUK21_03990 [Peptostreptococcaceae bacterium]|nr:hypothetical protein [Peptostreptococcaceae bacterium]MDY5739398.1 hypothetical protein [Anaerovoracaceae bacterium]
MLRNAKIIAIVKNNYQRIEIGENEVAKKENEIISIYNKGNEQAKEIIPVKNIILFEWIDIKEKQK